MLNQYNKYEEYIGKKFGYLTIISVSSKAQYVICECDCGEKNIERKLERLLKTKSGISSCGKCHHGIPFEYYIGKTYGFLTVNSFSRDKRMGVMVTCKCKCGNIVIRKFENNFINKIQNYCENCWEGNSLNSLIGKKIGTFTVIQKSYTQNPTGRTTQMVLKCKCGNEIKRTAKSIITNKTNICKCDKCYKGILYSDLIGKQFNNLTITNIKKSDKPMIVFKCSCGNIVEKTMGFLDSKNHKDNCGYCFNKIYFKNYIGKTYGLLTIQEIKKEKSLFKAYCKCKCGKTVTRFLSELGNNSECRNCYHGIPYEHYIGKTYGLLTVESIEKGERNKTKLKCRCKCGNITYRFLGQLERQKKNGKGRNNSCGKCYNGIPYEHYIGKTYGYLKIIKPHSNNNIFICDCICKCNPNVIVEKQLFGLINGTVNSCGCFRKNYAFIKQVKYGYLSILKPSRNTEGGVRYICKCDCGNEIEVLESDLFTGKVTCCDECKEIM